MVKLKAVAGSPLPGWYVRGKHFWKANGQVWLYFYMGGGVKEKRIGSLETENAVMGTGEMGQ